MDITPIYDLRDRLRTAMIAGTNLLAEDFRLKRAVEALAPLEKAAPVFAKVGELSRRLIAPDGGGEEGKEGILLDAITLVDAVCCTQGTVTVSGELTPVFTHEDDDLLKYSPDSGLAAVMSDVPYSALHPLQEALTSSGSGHYSFVLECHANHPELFKDYRVRAAMVQALGASYAELAGQVRDWLLKDGEDVIPLLLRGFNPKGKSEMVRRLHIIDQKMGAKANDFYIKQLETAEGELRQNLILSLRHTPENIDLLDDMRKHEKGNTKKAVYFALACQDDPRAKNIFDELYKKKPLDVCNFLVYSQTPWAASLAAKSVEQQFLTQPEKKGNKKEDDIAVREWEMKCAKAVNALQCKNGPEVCAAYRTAAKHCGEFGSVIHADVLQTLCLSLIANPTEDLLALAVSLYEGEDGRKQLFPAALLAKLISECSAGMENQNGCSGKSSETQTADGDWIGWLDKQLFEEKVPNHFLSETFRYLEPDEASKTFVLTTSVYGEIDMRSHIYTHPIHLEVRGRFLELLMRCNDLKIDQKLSLLFDPSDEEVCRQLEEYFYQKARSHTNRYVYLSALNRCGCTRCEGLLVNYARSKARINLWDLEYFIREMPGSMEAKFAEASRIPELVKAGKINIYNWNEESYKRWIENSL